MREHRVLRLQAEDGSAGYSVAGFDTDHPARPILGIKRRAAGVGTGRSGRVDDGVVAEHRATRTRGRTPRQALPDGEVPAVIDLAKAATGRLAALSSRSRCCCRTLP
nr:hypothetical protein [Rhodococcus opacus]